MRNCPTFFDSNFSRPLGSKSIVLALAIVVSTGIAHAETTLSDALRLAKSRNGTVKAAALSVQSSQASVGIALADYFPSLTPRYSYDTSRRDQYTGTSIGGRGDAGSTATLSASWRLWDNGSRKLSLSSQKSGLKAEEAQYIQTLRQILFSTTQQFYDALRASELVKVQDAQVQRSEIVLDQTKARVAVGDIAGKDILQAEADALNAKVTRIGAINRLRSAEASLKSTIGWDNQDGKLDISKPGEINLLPTAITEDEAKSRAIQNRPELISSRSNIESLKSNARLTKLNNGLTYSIDANYVRSLARDVSDQRSLGFTASIPLFNGGRSQAENKRAALSIQSANANLAQQERNILAEVESTYQEYSQNLLRLEAAKKALAASQKNFDAALASQKVGAATIVEVVTAQSSLVTAEVNAVEAIYDALISETRLKLVIGDPLPGETD